MVRAQRKLASFFFLFQCQLQLFIPTPFDELRKTSRVETRMDEEVVVVEIREVDKEKVEPECTPQSQTRCVYLGGQLKNNFWC